MMEALGGTVADMRAQEDEAEIRVSPPDAIGHLEHIRAGHLDIQHDHIGRQPRNGLDTGSLRNSYGTQSADAGIGLSGDNSWLSLRADRSVRRVFGTGR